MPPDKNAVPDFVPSLFLRIDLILGTDFKRIFTQKSVPEKTRFSGTSQEQISGTAFVLHLF